jgi:hypothetical protein
MKPAKPEAAPKKLNKIIGGTTDITASSNLVIKTATKDFPTITSAQKLQNLLLTRRLSLKYAPNPTRPSV